VGARLENKEQANGEIEQVSGRVALLFLFLAIYFLLLVVHIGSVRIARRWYSFIVFMVYLYTGYLQLFSR